MQLLSFFFVAVTVIFASYGVALDADRPQVAVGLCIGGLLLTAAFAVIDARTRSLIKAAESAILQLEARLGEQAGLPELKLVEIVEVADPTWSSYTKVIRAMLIAVAGMLLAGSIYGLTATASAEDEEKCPAGCAEPSERDHPDPASDSPG